MADEIDGYDEMPTPGEVEQWLAENAETPEETAARLKKTGNVVAGPDPDRPKSVAERIREATANEG